MKLDEYRLAHDERFALEPAMQLGPGPFLKLEEFSREHRRRPKR